MSAWIFAYNVTFAALALVVAFLPLRTEQPQGTAADQRAKRSVQKLRRILVAGALIALLPTGLTGVLIFYPQLGVAIFGLDTYARIEWEYWLPFAVLLFALASHLVPRHNRRALILLTCVVAGFTVQQKAWHVVWPKCYDLEGIRVDGICFQSTGFTCGAASAVTLLNTMGIESTEGEMAELTRTVPRRGVTSVGAAYGLKRKLARAKRPQRVTLSPCTRENLDELPTPFLVGMRFSLWFDHMVCVLKVGPDTVLIGDPLIGRKTWPRKDFEDEVRGLAVLVQP
jgi:hypothetical protein